MRGCDSTASCTSRFDDGARTCAPARRAGVARRRRRRALRRPRRTRWRAKPRLGLPCAAALLVERRRPASTIAASAARCARRAERVGVRVERERRRRARSRRAPRARHADRARLHAGATSSSTRPARGRANSPACRAARVAGLPGQGADARARDAARLRARASCGSRASISSRATTAGCWSARRSNDAGFDVRVTRRRQRGLLDAALDALPALARLRDRRNVGRRCGPASPDGRPYVGATAARGLLRRGRALPQRHPPRAGRRRAAVADAIAGESSVRDLRRIRSRARRHGSARRPREPIGMKATVNGGERELADGTTRRSADARARRHARRHRGRASTTASSGARSTPPRRCATAMRSRSSAPSPEAEESDGNGRPAADRQVRVPARG